MPSPHLPLLFLPMLFLSTLFVRTQPYTVSWNISEALKSVNENFVCWLCELWSFSQWQRCWEKSRNRGKWKVQQRKSKLPFLSSILACMFSGSRWYRSLSHHCFLQPIAFFFLPRHGELSKSTPTSFVTWPHYHPPPALPFGASRWNLRRGFACGRLIASEIPVLIELILLLCSLCSAFELVSRVIVWGCINWLVSKLCVLLSLWWILHLELREMLVKHETTTKDANETICMHTCPFTCVSLIWNLIPVTVNSMYWTISLHSLRLWWRTLSPFPLPQASEAHIKIGRIYYHFIFPPQLFRVSSIAGPVWDLISLAFAFVEQQFKYNLLLS